MEQPTLTEFFSTRKRPVEGVHPAKRRKLIESDSVVAEPAKTVRRSGQRVKSTLTTKPKQRATRARNAKSKQNEAPSNGIHRLFLRSEMKKATAESNCATSEVTAVADEHAVDIEETTPSLNEIPERKRKTRTEKGVIAEEKADLTNELDAGKAKEKSEGAKEVKDVEKQVEKPKTRKGRSRARTMKLKESGKEAVPASEKSSESKQSSDSTIKKAESARDNGSKEAEKASSEAASQPEIPAKSPSKKPPAVRGNAGTLKINPWISEQAKNVLLSRGKTALLLSQKKQTDSEGPKQKARHPRNGLTEAKAQEGLEKARQLIKNMRALEASAAKAKGSTTSDKPERLHEVAKRQSTEGASGRVGASSPKKTPAHERFHSLAQPTPPPSGGAVVTLPLPYKYKVLGEMFNCCDTVLNLLGQRNETCTFDKLKESVQKMCRKRFEKSHLAQINHLMPSTYDIKQVRVNQKSSSYQMTIQFGLQQNSTNVNRLTLPMTELLQRKKNFMNALLLVTKKHHKTFLQNLETPLTVEDDKIIRWHPKFKLDDVPDIELSNLPEAPVIKTFTTAKDVLERTRGIAPSKVEKALTSVAKKSEETNRIELTYSSKPTETNNKKSENTPRTSAALKGVSQDLLDKIRKRQAKKLEEDLMRDPVLDKKMSMRQRLPELCRILKTYFTSEKKAAIPLEDAVVKLSESYSTSLSSGQVDEHIKLLSTLVPEWLAILTIRKCPYVKINKKADINSVINKVIKMELS